MVLSLTVSERRSPKLSDGGVEEEPSAGEIGGIAGLSGGAGVELGSISGGFCGFSGISLEVVFELSDGADVT